MPIYEYKCKECGHIFEVLQGIGKNSKGLKCPKCQLPDTEKIFSTFSSGSSGKNTGSNCSPSGFS